MKETIGRAADPLVFVKKHPWIVIGSSIATGFLAGTYVIPTKRNIVPPTPTSAADNVQPTIRTSESSDSTLKSWWSTVVIALTTAVITALQGALTAAAGSYFATKEPSNAMPPLDDALHSDDLTSASD